LWKEGPLREGTKRLDFQVIKSEEKGSKAAKLICQGRMGAPSQARSQNKKKTGE